MKKGKRKDVARFNILVVEGTCLRSAITNPRKRSSEKNLLTLIGDARHAHRYPALCFGENNQYRGFS